MHNHPLNHYSFRLILVFMTITGSVFLILSPSCAGQDLIINSDSQFSYAENLFTKGEYSRAIDEYKRFIYFFPTDERVHFAHYKIGRAYYSSQNYETAVGEFNRLINKMSIGQMSNKALFAKSHWRVSECYVALAQFKAAIISLENLIALVKDRNILDDAYYRIGWVHIETASFDKAIESFSKINPENKPKFQVERVITELKKPLQIPRKDPTLTGFLSVLPGAGYVYCERYQDALIAFLVNAALIFAAYESFDKDLNALGAIISVVGVGFYAGNIYGATTSAHKYNRKKTRDFVETLKRNVKIQLSGSYQYKEMTVALRYSF